MFEPDKKQEWVAKNKEKRVHCTANCWQGGAPIATVGPDPKIFSDDKHTSSHLLQSLLRFTTTRCHWASAVHRPRRADGAEAQSKTLVEKGVGHPRPGAFPRVTRIHQDVSVQSLVITRRRACCELVKSNPDIKDY
jgi:hypothetical protein